jgi:hypothetical protein
MREGGSRFAAGQRGDAGTEQLRAAAISGQALFEDKSEEHDMTTHDARPAAAPDESDAPLSTPAPQARRDEPFTRSPDTADDSTRGDPDLPGRPRSDVAGTVDASAGVSDAMEGSSLIAPDRSADYRARWSVVQGDFIDEPRKAVNDADSMVGEILDQLADTFRQQRQNLEQNWTDDKSTTEDLRIALRRYRTFFDRLLSL